MQNPTQVSPMSLIPMEVVLELYCNFLASNIKHKKQAAKALTGEESKSRINKIRQIKQKNP